MQQETLKPKYNHSKCGNFLFNLCVNCSIKLYNIKWLFWLLQFTWGLPMMLFGFIVSLVLICCGKKHVKTPIGWRFEVGYGWGGFECGIVYVRDKKRREILDSLDCHEMGHCLVQNAILGPLCPFLVSIPSAIRYWYRELRKSDKYVPYDAVWFEDAASVGGEYFVKNLLKNN